MMRIFSTLTLTGRVVFFGLSALVLAAMLYLPTASASAPECRLTLQVRGNVTIEDYQALARRDHLEPIRIVAENSGKTACTGALTFQAAAGDGLMRGPDGTTLDYSIVGRSDSTRRLYDSKTAASQKLHIAVPPKSSRTLTPRLLVRRHQGGISGAYRARLDVEFRANGNARAGARAEVKLATRIKPSVQANFTGVSHSGGRKGGAHVNLGEITPGMRRSLGLQLRSNTDVDVEVSSYNHGRLTARGGGADDPSIGYHLTVGGQEVHLTGKSSIALPADISRAGKTSAVELQVEEFGDMPAGKYGDVILFRISGR